jgi:hypothetical protein
MKQFIVFLLLACFSVVCAMHLFALPASTESFDPSVPTSVVDFLSQHWEKLALIISEVAALISIKYSGFIKGALQLIGDLLKTKK